MLNPGDTAVVGIGNVLALSLAARLEEKAQLRLRALGLHRTQDAQVRAVHGEDVVERVEILLADLRGALLAQVVAALRGVLERARIRRLADVIVMRAGRG